MVFDGGKWRRTERIDVPTSELTHPLDETTTVYPGDPPVELGPAATHERDGYRVTELRLGSHAGTHVDAPSHTEPDGKELDEFAVERFAFDARLADCSEKGVREPIRRAELESKVGDERVQDTDLLVVRTGWDAHWGSDRYFDHPYLDADAAAWCAERGLSVGMDALSPDPTPSENAAEQTSANSETSSQSAADREPDGVPAHRELLGRDRLVAENLTNLGDLPERFELRVYPLALAADGAPARAVAVW